MSHQPAAADQSASPLRISRDERFGLLRQRGAVVWLTGLSGAGKTTIARACERQLIEAGRVAYVLDGDEVRQGLSRDLGFSPTDRHEQIRRVGEVVRLFADAGVIVIVALISPYAADRAAARACAVDLTFLEVFVDASMSHCEARDTKGLYRQARNGTIGNLTGLGSPYEVPTAPDLRLSTGEQSVAESLAALWRLLGVRGLLLMHESTPSSL